MSSIILKTQKSSRSTLISVIMLLEQQESLIEDLLISDGVVTIISTVIFDTVIFEKPIIFVNVAGTATSSLGGFQKEMIENDVSISTHVEDLVSTILSLKKGMLVCRKIN
jgi:CDP-glycerol glycerophosphotransferase (TagB/SpsB family)